MNAVVPYVGQPIKRREDFKLLTGKGRYVDDIKLPGMLHMVVVRSPHGHAEIKGVDFSRAEVTGPYTGRRIHTLHCSDKCRVAAMRARKRESE